MESLHVICLKTNQLVYSYSCEDESYLPVAKHRANKRFKFDYHRFTTTSDYDHTFNRDLYLGYEVIGTINYSCPSSEYIGQTGY